MWVSSDKTYKNLNERDKYYKNFIEIIKLISLLVIISKYEIKCFKLWVEIYKIRVQPGI